MKSLIFITLLFSFPILFNAQTTSPEFDVAYAEKLQQALTDLGVANNFKGLSAAVSVPGQGIWVGSWGEADQTNALTPNMRLGIASNTKAIIAGLMLKLEDEGLLNLQDKISQYLPDYTNVSGEITIDQLLTHTSGLFDFINDMTAATQLAYNSNPDSIWSNEALLAAIGPALYPVGERFSYSNTNYLLAGMIAEAATNSSLQDLLKTKVFDPLDLAMAYPPYDDIFSSAYANLWEGGQPSLTPTTANTFLSFSAAAGAIWSTPYDMVRWYEALFRGDWLSSAAQAKLRDNDGYTAYALGLRLQNDSGRSLYYHAGAWGYRSYMVHDPKTGISLCLLSNLQGESVSNSALTLLNEVYGEKPLKENDGVLTIVDPQGALCSEDSDPTINVNVKNAGTEPIDALQFRWGIDGNWMDSAAINILVPIAPGEEVTIALGEVDMPYNFDKRRLIVELQSPMNDEYPDDNVDYVDFLYSSVLLVGYNNELWDMEEELAFPEELISLSNQDLLDWRITKYNALDGEKSLARNNFWDANLGVKYSFELPALWVSTSATRLDFDFAHASYSGTEMDDLRIYISTDCGETFSLFHEMIDNDFITAPPTTDLFRPTSDDWQHVELFFNGDLSGGLAILRFELENDYGNLVYIDNIKFNNASATKNTIVNALRVYPNPGNDQTTVLLNGNFDQGSAQLIDTFGKIVRTFNITQGQQKLIVEKGDLAAGIYYLKIQDRQNNHSNNKMVFQ